MSRKYKFGEKHGAYFVPFASVDLNNYARAGRARRSRQRGKLYFLNEPPLPRESLRVGCQISN